jgi:hypothetical protein
MVVEIGSTTQSALKYEDVVVSLLSEETRKKIMDSHNTNSLFARGHTQYRNTNNSSGGVGGRSKYKGISKSLGEYLTR